LIESLIDDTMIESLILLRKNHDRTNQQMGRFSAPLIGPVSYDNTGWIITFLNIFCRWSL